ncbi:MAG TPA: hypothetical protein VHB74_11755 [Devosia sp.]|jgi:hypothetical protein|nr:hypothetical protein [Devosia sp.]
MRRFLPLLTAVLAATLCTASLALPARAASVASCQSEKVRGPNGLWIDRVEVFAQQYAMRLRQLGYNVERVEPWGGCVRAFIDDGGGRSHMAFFDPDTLEELSTN